MPDIELTLCGLPTLRIDGAPASASAVPTKSMALVAFLALESGPHSREELATLLWGDSPQNKASASLRQALSTLRDVLGERILIERSTVSLVEGIRCDVTTFLELAKVDAAGAVKVDVPRFLAGFSPKHCQRFDEWADGFRNDLMVRYRRALTECARLATARRDWRRGVELGERWLQADPTSNQAAHLLVESLYMAGDTAGALARYEEFSARHEAILGAVPDFELRELVKRLGGRRAPTRSDGGNDDWHHSTETFEAGLTGRASEWDALVGAWREVGHGGSRIVVVEGEAGAGKSRLADDFCRWVTTQGGRVLRARAYEYGLTTRFGTIFDVLRAALELPGSGGADATSLGVLARILPDIRRRFPATPPFSGEPEPALLNEAVADLLLAAAEDRPLMVLVDDFHWSDPDSSAMLHQLVRRLEDSPVLWYTTLTLGHVEREAPATRVARALRAMPGTLRLQLGPLTADDVWGMIRDLGRVRAATAGRRLANRVHEVTGGNPFYVVELLKTLLAQNWMTVHPETREWIVSDQVQFDVQVGTMSPTVQEAIAQRIARLPDELRTILMTIATHASGCPAYVLSNVHGISRLRAAAMGDELAERYLVGEENGRYQCAHAVIASVVRDAMRPARRRELHRAIALAMITVAEEGGTSIDSGEVAYHAHQGEERTLAYQHAMLATEAARQRAAYDEALSWLDVASSCAVGPEQTATVDRATASLLEAAGWAESRPPARRSSAGFLSRPDFDLTGGHP